MATDRKGDQTNPETIHPDEKNQPTPSRRPEAIPNHKKKTQHTTTLAVTRIKGLPKATPRRKRLDTHTIKINYIKRLEDLWRQIDTLLSDPETDELYRVRLINSLMRCLQIAYGMVESIEVFQLEAEIEAFEKEEAANRAENKLGYRLPDPTK